MASQFYSSVEDVKNFTGVKYDDLRFDNDDDYNDWLENRLVEIKDMIDRDRGRNYHDEDNIPPGIHHIALRMAANLLAIAVIRRDTLVVRLNEFTLKMVEDQIFTPAIRSDLSTFPRKPKFSMFRVNTSGD